MRKYALLAIILIFLTACTTEVVDEVELTTISTESEIIPPELSEKNQQAKDESEGNLDIPTTLLPFSYQSASGASIPPKVNFLTEDGVKIIGSYFEPEYVPAPTVIMLPMLGKTRGDYSQFAKSLQASGYAVLTMDFRGHGSSVYQSGSRISYKDFEERDWKRLYLDLRAAKEYLSAKGDMSSLALLGSSIGANVALQHAVTDFDVDLLILLSPGLDYRGVESLHNMEGYGKRPVLLAAASDDQYAAFSTEELDAAAKGPHLMLMYEGKKHGSDLILTHQDLDDYIFTWLGHFLK